LALSKVVQLQPDYREAYLALAVSYTNEGEKEAANTMLERWLDLTPSSARKHVEDGDADTGREKIGYEARRARVVERLIDMANLNPEEVDPEVQIALGVLFNASEVSLCGMSKLEQRLMRRSLIRLKTAFLPHWTSDPMCARIPARERGRMVTLISGLAFA
jgi:hypothetical protein